jgi:hypothetical protein
MPVSKSIVYYTDLRLEETIGRAVRSQLERCSDGIEIVSVSLGPVDFGINIVLQMERGPLAMFRQILAGIEASASDIIFFAEHDVLYSPGYFSFVPPSHDKIWYNLNLWQVRASDGHCVYWDAKRVSQLCAYRELLVEHYRKRIELVEKNGFSMKTGYEPASHNRQERVDNLQSDIWRSKIPNLDIKHGHNLSPSKWSKADFRSQRNCQNWQESDSVPGWGKIEGRFDEFLHDVTYDKM